MNHATVGEIGSDPDALEAFYREHLESVQRFVARRVAVPQDAADLTAEVFLAAIGSCGRYRPSAGPPIAWLYGIARNIIAVHYRSAGRAARANARLAAHDLATNEWIDADAADRLAARIDAERTGRQLIEAMVGLPERQRAVLELVAVDGLSLVDAAAVLGISQTNARVRYHRARHKLTSLLGRAPLSAPYDRTDAPIDPASDPASDLASDPASVAAIDRAMPIPIDAVAGLPARPELTHLTQETP